MRTTLLISGLLLVAIILKAQSDSLEYSFKNSADRLITNDRRLTLGGYGEVHYNQPLSSDTKNNGTLDVHRVVLLVGYKFNDRTQFVTEIEFEHVKEVYVEQAFLQYKINKSINFRAGLLLIPMGIVNEYHEPTTFNGIERPLVDKYISPTTWREIGLGLTGNIFPVYLKYQVYLVNGFNGFDGSANLSGKNGLRKGRQKGAESFISSPNFSGKIEYYGVRGLNIGLSGYYGNTQTTLYQGIGKSENESITKADSSVVGVSMVGLDARYSIVGIELRGQYYFTSLSNTSQYNIFTTNEEGVPNNLGSSMLGFYFEAGYNVFKPFKKINTALIPFVRIEAYNTQNSVEEGIAINKAYNNSLITTGLTWRMAKGAVLKADMQFLKSEADSQYATVFNAGFGVMF